MNKLNIVRAFFEALDSENMSQVDQYISEDFQVVDFSPKPMDRDALLEFLTQLKKGIPNLRHSLSNLNAEGNVVKLTVQLSGRNSDRIDLRHMGIGIIPSTRRFIIFPSANFEATLQDDKFILLRDVSPDSPSRRISGMLRALGVNVAAL